MTASRLIAGAASVSITPPVGVDLMGYLRRSEPARGYGQPMEATALVLGDGTTRIVLVGADLVGASGAWAQTIRDRIGAAVGAPAHHVLLNSQHTHAAPPTPGWAKIGGDADWNEEEVRYGDAVGDLVVSAAVEAARRTRPARVGFGRTIAEGITVNRRQRVEGGTILGWNPDEQCDRDVAVIRVDDEAGGAICTVVAFASHPVVIGPDVPEASSDFVGPLRARVRAWTGGECVFLQGCAGNIVPFESFHTEPGPERLFGERLALAALQARAEAGLAPSKPVQVPFTSAIPIAIWRHVPVGVEDTMLGAAWPCEPFCELGLEVKEQSVAPFPVTLGYSNDLIGYVPTRREYPFGGYEPVVAQRHFGRPAPFAPEAGEELVRHALELTTELFERGPSAR